MLLTNMRNAAVRALKAGEKVPDLTQPPAITSENNQRLPALLTNAYCPTVHEGLTLCKRLANCDSEDDLRAIQVQFIKNPLIDPADIVFLIQSDRSFKLAGPDKLTWQKPTAALDQRVAAVKDLFRRLKP